jgi:hypothetical protein
MIKMKSFLILAVVVAFFATGCGKKEEAPVVEKSGDEVASLPSGHGAASGVPTGEAPNDAAHGGGGLPPMDMETAKAAHTGLKHSVKKEIRVSPEVKSKWPEITLNVKGTVQTFKLGEKTSVGGAYSLLVEAFVPDYTIYEGYVGSKSIDPNNPAVYVELFDGSESVASGWIFKMEMFQSFNSYASDKYPVELITPESASK